MIYKEIYGSCPFEGRLPYLLNNYLPILIYVVKKINGKPFTTFFVLSIRHHFAKN